MGLADILLPQQSEDTTQSLQRCFNRRHINHHLGEEIPHPDWYCTKCYAEACWR